MLVLLFGAVLGMVRSRASAQSLVERVRAMPPGFLVIVLVVALFAAPATRSPQPPDPRISPAPPPAPPVAVTPLDAGVPDALPGHSGHSGVQLADKPVYAGTPLVAEECTPNVDPLIRECFTTGTP